MNINVYKPEIEITQKSSAGTEKTFVHYLHLSDPIVIAFLNDDDYQEMILASGSLMMYRTYRKNYRERH